MGILLEMSMPIKASWDRFVKKSKTAEFCEKAHTLNPSAYLLRCSQLSGFKNSLNMNILNTIQTDKWQSTLMLQRPENL